jgi:hypothetical protein
VTHPCLGCIPRDDFGEPCALSLSLSQYAPEPLNEFSGAAGPTQNDCLRGLGNVDALIEHFGGDYHSVLSIAKPVEYLPALIFEGGVRYRWDQKRPSDAINELIMLSENNSLLRWMLNKKFFKRLHFCS